VHLRGRYMQEAVPVGTGAMAAILGMPPDKVQQVCHDAALGQVCSPANINSPEQIVISGNSEAVQRAADLARQRGAKRAILLQVSAPFHCTLLLPAQERMAHDLAQLQFRPMEIPVVTNVDANFVSTPDAARDALVRQVTGAVQWDRCVRQLIARGVETFVEVGPGKVLCGLMKQIDRSRTCVNVEGEASLEKTLNHFSHARTGAF
ncbi:MAG: ACP S-malonyltransferase, partial [Acidobacteria bacterium]|nr:ACP S-malonyltransferase [Acidobacteriota bacterium]